jgi:PAS domain S-box-containing protein
MLGHENREALLGRELHGLIHAACRDDTSSPETCPVWRAIRTNGIVRFEDEELVRGDGTRFPAEYRSYPMVRNGTMVGTVVIFSDITERKAREAEHLHAQRMEAMGQLTGGIAHDFNNLLAIILANLRMLAGQFEDGADAATRELLDDTLSAAEDGAELTKRLLLFSRRHPLEPRVWDVNELIESERARSTRYRESLDNLAHSLKTPMAVVRSQIEATGPIEERAGIVIDQVDRMQGIVDYQLRRAAAGSAAGGPRVEVEPVAEATLSALRKVYADRAIDASATIEPGSVFRGDRGDLAEILGNLLDNAFKWCRNAVRLEVRRRHDGERRRPGLTIVVEDDGPGLDPERARSLTRRGERGDREVPGQGIGLAVVSEILDARGGGIEFGQSGLGCARVTAWIPPVGTRRGR